MKVLVIEEPYQTPETQPWNEETQLSIRQRFDLDDGDLDTLNVGGIIWRGDTALSIDDEPEPEAAAPVEPTLRERMAEDSYEQSRQDQIDDAARGDAK
jgi:hypothetical protein